MIREIDRVPAERDTEYAILRRFGGGCDEDDGLDGIKDVSRFGSYMELVKIGRFDYKNPRRRDGAPLTERT